ncbi:MAG: MCE family protein [Deltaproteobacteria bacterium]|nr:MCE family protein [Deltaproteobacteria bacterium]MBN2687160.1 MCE family protein [Deltaproteobacteria bacterium]
MVSISTEAKVGLFVLVALIILGYMSFRVGEYGFGFKKGYVIHATFDNVTGLDKDASVLVAGVEVGRVESITLKDGRAVVAMRIIPGVELEKDSRVSIKSHGILGDKFIEIEPGTRGLAPLGEGGEITRVEKQADIDKILRDLGTIAQDVMAVTASLRKVVGGEEGVENLRAIVRNTRELSDNLNRVVKQNDEKFSVMVDSLKSAAHQMDRTFSALSDITERINAGEGTVGKLVNDQKVFDNLDQTVASLQDITDKINKGEGSIGKLVNDEETVDNLNSSLKSLGKSMEGIDRYVSKAEQFRTFLSYRGEYLFDKSDAKSYVDIKIQPKEDKFYIFGVVADPKGKRTVTESKTGGTTTKTEEWERNELLFNLMIGKRFKDLVVRGGILESTGGAGLDYFAFDDALKVSFEAFDFDTDRDPHLKVYGEYRLFKHLYLMAGWDDFVSDEGNASPFAGIAIRFEDDDLKYLLTDAPIPTK